MRSHAGEVSQQNKANSYQPSHGVQRQLGVEGSADGQHWVLDNLSAGSKTSLTSPQVTLTCWSSEHTVRILVSGRHKL